MTSGDLEDTGTLADDEAEVTDIRREEDQGETKEGVGTPVPVNGETDEEKDDEEKENEEKQQTDNARDEDDVTEEQNKVNEEIEVSKSPAPSENKASLQQSGISDHLSSNEEVIEKDHKRLEGMF